MPEIEKTFVIIKPDAVERRLAGEIISRFEKKGLRIAALKMLKVDRKLAEIHYGEHRGKPFYEPLLRFITSGHVIAMVVEGDSAVQVVRNMVGLTDGRQAAAGTVRGDHSLSNRFNLVHGSDSMESAKREIVNFFEPEEINSEDPVNWS
jgi:nucleoside-diphosphate kinase